MSRPTTKVRQPDASGAGGAGAHSVAHCPSNTAGSAKLSTRSATRMRNHRLDPVHPAITRNVLITTRIDSHRVVASRPTRRRPPRAGRSLPIASLTAVNAGNAGTERAPVTTKFSSPPPGRQHRTSRAERVPGGVRRRRLAHARTVTGCSRPPRAGVPGRAALVLSRVASDRSERTPAVRHLRRDETCFTESAGSSGPTWCVEWNPPVHARPIGPAPAAGPVRLSGTCG
jgi:hypothetical protein